jgi:hypothetical protein
MSRNSALLGISWGHARPIWHLTQFAKALTQGFSRADGRNRTGTPSSRVPPLQGFYRIYGLLISVSAGWMSSELLSSGHGLRRPVDPAARTSLASRSSQRALCANSTAGSSSPFPRRSKPAARYSPARSDPSEFAAAPAEQRRCRACLQLQLEQSGQSRAASWEQSESSDLVRLVGRSG